MAKGDRARGRALSPFASDLWKRALSPSSPHVQERGHDAAERAGVSLRGLELRKAVGRAIDPVAVATAAAPLCATVWASATTIYEWLRDRYIRNVPNDVPHARVYRHVCRSQYGQANWVGDQNVDHARPDQVLESSRSPGGSDVRKVARDELLTPCEALDPACSREDRATAMAYGLLVRHRTNP